MILFYRIGGISFQIEDYFHEDMKKVMEPYRIEALENPDMKFVIHTECRDMTAPEGTLVAEVNGRSWFTMPDGGCAFIDEAAPGIILNKIVCSKHFKNIEAWFCPFDIFDMPADHRPFYMIHEVFKHALLELDGAIVHSSSLAYQGKGLIFSASSGTGKSTHTGLWQKYAPGTEIVNDDMPIVRFHDGTPYIYGSPWSGKNLINTNITVPLSAVVFLERGEKNELLEADKNDAVFRLVTAMRKPIIPEFAEKSLEFIGKLVETLPLYRLRCTISEEAVQVAMKAL